MKKTVLFCVLCLVFTISCVFLPTEKDAEIYTKTLRLHVIANSNSEEDQALKLKVRDAILSKMSDLFSSESDIDSAKSAVNASLEEITSTAKAVISENGYDYDINVKLCTEYYPTKSYGDVTLPAGEYSSLQVRIGESKGENWWCVLFPPICLSPATAKEELSNSGFDNDQIEIITESQNPKYKVKFKILEYISKTSKKDDKND